MRNLLFAALGALAGSAIVVGIAVAAPGRATISMNPPGGSAMPMGGTMMGSSDRAPASRKLTILHVQRGCHTWSNGTMRSPMMRLTLAAGGRLSILDQDLDAHKLMQVSGPARLRLGGPMMMNHGTIVSFPKKGVYRLRTKTVEMPGGMTIEAETIGPDNTLRLVVTVA